MVEVDTILDAVCRIPLEFFKGSKSFLDLINESGIRNQPHLLTVSNLTVRLQQEPCLITPWLRWSTDRRLVSGWHIKCKDGRFVVGLQPAGQLSEFDAAEQACAHFIFYEISSVIKRLPSVVP